MYKVRVLRPERVWPATEGSEAVAEKVMLPLTVPARGEVMETVGAVTSGVRGGAWVVAEALEL
jgi:hypothetical protein